MRALTQVTEDAIRLEFGPDTLAAVRRAAAAHAGGAADEPARFAALLRGLAVVRRQSPAEAHTWAGTAVVFGVLRERPALLGAARSLPTMLLRINETLEAELPRWWPGAAAPFFDVELLGADTVAVQYRAGPLLDGFCRGGAEGLALAFDARVEVTAEATAESAVESSPGAVERRRFVVRLLPERRSPPPPPQAPKPAPDATERRRGVLGGLFGRRSR